MDAAYPGHGIISNKNRKLFDVWECQCVKRIENIQSNKNPFEKQLCLEEGLW
jgi:deoxyribonuclease-1